jgi:TetR/AcrR family transcriptional repressor of nem operon
MAGRPRSFEPDAVLERAMHVFWAKGYEATGIADLEDATGLGRQSLYGAFGDKRALFARVVDFYFERVLKPGLVDVLDAPGSARKNLELVFHRWIEVATAPDFNGCLVGNGVSAMSPGDPELADLLRRKLKLLEEALVRVLRRAQEAREVPATLDPRATARSLLAISQGLAVIGRVHRERSFISSVVDGARRLLD